MSLWYRLRPTISDINYAARRMVELQMCWLRRYPRRPRQSEHLSTLVTGRSSGCKIFDPGQARTADIDARSGPGVTRPCRAGPGGLLAATGQAAGRPAWPAAARAGLPAVG